MFSTGQHSELVTHMEVGKILLLSVQPSCMPVSVRRLMAYYRSPAFAEDYAYLDRYDPLAAQQQRYAIIGKFNDNLESLGITPTRTEMAVQERFLAGDLTLTDLLAHVELYVESIALRWPE